MEQVQLRSLQVSRIGLGCMPLTTTYGRPNPKNAMATVRTALAEGITLFDTADMYGAGENERLLGRALGHHRKDVVIASKLGIVAMPGLGVPLGLNARPARVKKCVENSLRRLGTDYLDLLYLHRVDPSVPIEETIGTMAEFVSKGLVREIGVCEVTPEQLSRAHATHPIAAMQSEWSIFTRGIEEGSRQEAKRIGAVVVAYSPLGRGMLTGASRATTNLALLDVRRFLPRWRRQNLARNLAAVELIRDVAHSLQCTSAQAALAWVLQKGSDVIPIPGTANPRHLRSNIAALDITLPREAREKLDSMQASGDRGEGFGRN